MIHTQIHTIRDGEITQISKWREPQQPQQQGGFRQPPPGIYQKPFAQSQPQS